jgi:vacuolar-type H+-ATPase subunit I/STV1
LLTHQEDRLKAMLQKDYLVSLRLEKIERKRKQRAMQAKDVQTKEAERVNLQKTLMEGDRKEKIQEVNDRHRKNEQQVKELKRRVRERLEIKKEIGKLKSEQALQFRRHLERQSKANKFSIMMREQLKTDRLRRIEAIYDKIKKTRNKLTIKSLTYRDQLNEKISNFIVEKGIN